MSRDMDPLDGTTEFIGKDNQSLHVKVQKVESNDKTEEAVLLEFINREELEIGMIPGVGMASGVAIQGFGIIMAPHNVRALIEFLEEQLESIPFKAIEVAGIKVEL